ncbi:MAG: tripartite tricarboxylate transporter TctB family protein [Candidatus Accumulibacter sp.]|jgi:putative tricarboxylic transport membrane protein|nr:tripartite tricarboxylate transporter TctB family protein [Accumulibacter sp.]
MKKANHDTYIGIVFLFFCGFAWWQISRLPLGVGYQHTIGPEFFPGVMTSIIAILSAALIARSLWRGATASSGSPLARGNTLLRIALFVVLLLAYTLIYEPLGFLLSSCLALPAGMFMLGERRPAHVLLFPAIIIGLGYVGFTKIMMVQLPGFPSHLF